MQFRDRALSGDKRVLDELLRAGATPQSILENYGDTFGQASWYTGADWSERDSQANAAYMLMFGREIDASGLAEWRVSGLSPSEWAKQLSATPEAMSGGVNPAWFGNKVIDPGTLTGEDRSYYDAWAAANPGQAFYSSNLDYVRWAQDSMSLTAFQAEMSGDIESHTRYTPETGQLFNYKVVTPDAAKAMGNTLDGHLFGNRAGDIVYAPAGMDSHDQMRRAGPAITEGPMAGLAPYQATGHLSSGLFDSAFGDDIGSFLNSVVLLSNPVMGAVELATGDGEALGDPFNWQTPLLAGEKEGMRQQQRIYKAGDTVGMDPEQTAEAQRYGATAAIVVGSFFNPFIGATLATAQNASAAQMGYQDWDVAAINSGMAWASAGISHPGNLNAFESAGVSAGMATASAFLRGEDFNAALEEGAWAGGTSLVSSGIRSGAGTLGATSPVSQAFIGAGTNYITAEIRSELDDGFVQTDMDRNISLAQGAFSGYTGSFKKDPATGKLTLKTSDDYRRMFQPSYGREKELAFSKSYGRTVDPAEAERYDRATPVALAAGREFDRGALTDVLASVK